MEVFLDGFEFPESLRWHDNRLWFSDMNGGGVFAADEAGTCRCIVDVPGAPSGLGWLADGRMLVVSMAERSLFRLDPNGLVRVADLTAIAPGVCNDMVTDALGRAFIGNFGFDLRRGEAPKPTVLARVDTDGSVRIAAEDVLFPNGMVLSGDGKTLLLAETFAARITAFSVSIDGALSARRIWASLPGKTPDGIAMGPDQTLWVASPHTDEILCLAADGQIVDSLKMEQSPFSCVVGGSDGKTLFIASSRRSMSREMSQQGKFGTIMRHRLA